MASLQKELTKIRHLTPHLNILLQEKINLNPLSSSWLPMLNVCKLNDFYKRRTVLCKRLFSKMLEPTRELNALVPPKNLQTYDLRSYSNLLVPRCRTERFSNSFIPAASRAYNNK